MVSSITRQDIVPFLKWAGGKRWLIDTRPDFFDVEYERYVEPFLGGAAVYFKLQPQDAILTDSNSDLINTYHAVCEAPNLVRRYLANHQAKHNKEYYYKIRSSVPKSMASRAAKFIYLNRTCWNGLYRVNLKGTFNVPIGTKTQVVLPSDDFQGLSKLLRGASLGCCDFEETISQCGTGDLVFCDPPYTVKHNFNGFVKYNENLFSWEDQVRLRDTVKSASRRGAKVIVTNAYHSCLRHLYQGIGKIYKVERASVISGKSSSRGRYEEMVVVCG